VVRGELFRLPPPRRAVGHEQRGARYGVVVQADELLGMSTALVAPTSTSALPMAFRPRITVKDEETRVLVERTAAVDIRRLGHAAGRLTAHELHAVDDALRLVLGLR
jgi:mRNA interferase MazF